MAKYSLTLKAIEDLSKIWDYTFEIWSESQADKYYLLLIDTCKKISTDPKAGKNYKEIDTGIYGLKVNQHIIFYRISKPKEIVVLRILHVKMDLKNRI